jgi:RNA polymerase sigma-32 factor
MATKRLSVREERTLIRRWQEQRDERALAELVRSLRWLIEHHARKLRIFGESTEDLIQEGELGAVQAIQRFDLSRTTKLSTYAIHWIRAQMMQYVMQNRRIVRLPTSSRVRHDFFELSRARQQLTDESRSALATALHWNEKRVDMLSGPLGRDIPLDAAVTLADPHPGPEQMIMEAEEKARYSAGIARGLRRLDARERYIIQRRWLGEKVAPLSAVGRQLGVSRERVRQIELRAQKKLRHTITDLV